MNRKTDFTQSLDAEVLIIGAAIVDIIINIEKLPHSGEDITAKSTKHTIGGCAFNVADVLNKLHLPFDLMIPIGNGDYSKIIYKSFKEKNNYMEEIADIINRPVIVTWSDASTSESNLKNMFSSEESYKRYAEYKKNDKPYPVKVEAIAPLQADKDNQSTICIKGTITGDYELIKGLCERFTEELTRQLNI